MRTHRDTLLDFQKIFDKEQLRILDVNHTSYNIFV